MRKTQRKAAALLSLRGGSGGKRIDLSVMFVADLSVGNRMCLT